MTTEQLIVTIRGLLDEASPAPWHQTPDTPWGSKVICSESGEMYLGVSALAARPTGGWTDEAHQRARDIGQKKCADARLIAAAPDLLTQCVAVIELLTSQVNGGWQEGYNEGWADAMNHVRKVVA